MISRELFELREVNEETHSHDFLTIGAMGHASQIAHGLAIGRPDKKIICLDGDGAMIMHMGGMATIGASQIKNFIHILLNNEAHDSVGGQPTSADKTNFPKIALACGYTDVASVDNVPNLNKKIKIFLKNTGCFFLEVKVARGARIDLGRPSLSTHDSLEIFRREMSENI
jgi:phosphonopyruvate decarboxylase